MSKHNKKVALITGAKKGIGFEISHQLAGKGITVVAGARSEDSGRTACNRLRDAGMDVHFQLIDVNDEGSISSAVPTSEKNSIISTSWSIQLAPDGSEPTWAVSRDP